jgi:RNA polymerase sigma-70 factor (ECF subfamily)
MEDKLLHKKIRKVMNGDQEAFAEIYREYAKTIYFHTCNYLWDQSEAEDVAQDVVIRMLKNIGTLKSPYAFTVWMHQIIRNVCYDYNTAFSKKRSKDDSMDGEEYVIDDDVKNDPVHAAQSTDAKDLIYSEIQKLPEKQRMAVIMHYYDGMKHREIAKVLGTEEVTVATNIMKAKKKLKEIFENDKRFGGAEELLGAAALGPALQDSLTHAADGMMPPHRLSEFCDAVAVKVQAYLKTASAAKAAAGGVLKGKLVAGVMGAIVTAGAVYYAVDAGGASQGTQGREAQVFVPRAEIVLEIAEDEMNATNPLAAALVMKDENGTPAGWRILNASGAAVASGSGETVTSALTGLAPGEYMIEWTIVKGKAEAFVKRTFFIDNS